MGERYTAYGSWIGCDCMTVHGKITCQNTCPQAAALAHMDSNEVAYWYYVPQVQHCACDCGRGHNKTTGYKYYAKMTDGQSQQVSKVEYDARRFGG